MCENVLAARVYEAKRFPATGNEKILVLSYSFLENIIIFLNIVLLGKKRNNCCPMLCIYVKCIQKKLFST